MILYLDEEYFGIQLWQWWKLTENIHAQREYLNEALDRMLSTIHYNTLLDIIIESVDETYQQEWLPNINQSEQRILINKKIKHYFSQQSFSAAHRVADIDHKIHYSLIGIDIDLSLQTILDLLRHYPIVLKGVYLSSQIAVDKVVRQLNNKLSKQISYLLIELIYPNSIRKTVIQNAQLVYSHRNSLLDQQLIPDIENSIYFYQQINLLDAKQDVHCLFLTNHHQINIVAIQQLQQECINHQGLSITASHQVASRAEYLIKHLKRYTPRLNLLAKTDLHKFYALRIKYYVLLVSILIIAGLMINLIHMVYVQKNLEQVSHISHLQKLNLQKKFLAQQSLLPVSPDSLDKIQTLVSIDSSLVNAKQSPESLLLFLSKILTSLPEIQLQRLRWITSVNPAYPDQDANPLDKVAPSQAHKSLYQVLYLDGYLDDHSSSLSVSGKIFQHFIFTLKQHEDLYRIDILQHPIMQSLDAKNGLNAEQLLEAKQFKLRISFAVEDD